MTVEVWPMAAPSARPLGVGRNRLFYGEDDVDGDGGLDFAGAD